MATSKKSLRKAKEIRAILADMGADTIPSSTLKKPPTYTITSKLIVGITRVAYKALHRTGRISNHNFKRKVPDWPYEAKTITVIGFGIEKIAYKVTPLDPKGPIMVVSVYHHESLRKPPAEIIRKKREKYETYRKYFSNLIVPTTFTEIDNPWGEGNKPASIQPFLEDPRRFSDYSFTQLKTHAAKDTVFAKDLRTLKEGYERMLTDKVRPDFGGGNLVVVGSNIKIFDTGAIVPADKYKKLRNASPAYRLVESIDNSVFVK